jgi:transposase
MEYITPADRSQVEMLSLEQMIGPEDPVRFVDLFVEKLDLPSLGFQVKTLKNEGRPAFHPRVLLKLYFYGYLNGLRSSRRMEKECRRNLEVMWLLGRLSPNYHTIADFRKDNPRALKNTFRLFVLFLRDMDLVSGHTVAIDGTKVRAHNSKKNNYNPKKIERHLRYIEEKTTAYLKELEENDRLDSPVKVKQVKEKLARLKDNKLKYEHLQASMDNSGEPQVSTTDEDARALLVQGQVVEVCYNTQTAVDSQHKLVVATHTINRNDRNALTAIASEAKSNLEAAQLTALSDKGYHNGRELQQCKDQNITTICAQQEAVNSNEQRQTQAGMGSTTPEYMASRFTYHATTDSYTCPQGATLTTTGTWHKKTRQRDSHQFKKYRTPACKTCPARHLCTGRVSGGREIERSEYAEATEENARRYAANADLYRKRQEWNEHIFGTIKRKWGYSYTNLKGLSKVNGEMALIMTVYNIKRCMNILGTKDLMEKMKRWVPNYKRVCSNFMKMTIIEPILREIKEGIKILIIKPAIQNSCGQ